MKPPVGRVLSACLLLLVAGCGAPAQNGESEGRDVAETSPEAAAREIMDRMATAIRARDAELMISVYPETGPAVFIANTRALFSHDSIAASYRRWNDSPVRAVDFEWRDVQYEVLGPEAVVGIARFRWVGLEDSGPSPDTLHGIWTGVFRRSDGHWSLMVEHEGF